MEPYPATSLKKTVTGVFPERGCSRVPGANFRLAYDSANGKETHLCYCACKICFPDNAESGRPVMFGGWQDIGDMIQISQWTSKASVMRLEKAGNAVRMTICHRT